MNRTFWLAKMAKFLLAAALFITVLTFATQHIWNWLVPEVFHGPALSVGQTFGLLVLSRILFGGWGRGWGQGGQRFARGRAWKQQMEQRLATFTPEEREKFRQQMRARCASGWGSRSASTPEPQ